ncbi:MAG: BTAD domain-containing putative transcriptional regulator [Frankiaceae bacterium]
MEIEILGPLCIRESGVGVVPSAPKPRTMLALLACQADHVVSTEAVIEELWGEQVPRSAMVTVQTYVMQLRTHIAAALALRGAAPDAAKSILVTRGRGYLLASGGGPSDLVNHDRLAETGQAAAERGDLPEARRLLRAALALWRGPAIADVRLGRGLAAHALRLEEARLSLAVQALDVELRLGNHHHVLGELAMLTKRNPLHERLHELQMLALYRAGRREPALRLYGRLRATLDERLGLEPVSSVQRLHRAIVSLSPELDLVSAPIAS